MSNSLNHKINKSQYIQGLQTLTGDDMLSDIEDVKAEASAIADHCPALAEALMQLTVVSKKIYDIATIELAKQRTN